MPTIRFKLRTDATDKQGYAPISLVYQNGRKETFLSTGKKTKLECFDKGNNHEPIKTNCTEAKEMNIALRGQFNRLTKIVDTFYLTENNYPTNDFVKLTWNGSPLLNENLYDTFDRFVRYQQSKGSNSVSDGTSRNYEKVIKKVKQYEKFSRKTLTLESLNENFANLYNDWLIRHHDYLPNSVGEHLKIIGTFLRWCEKDGKAINRNALEAFKGSNDKTWAIYLTITELKQLSVLESEFNDIRDAFVLQSCLGVRHSDLKTVIQTKIIKEDDNYYYVTNTKKTNKLIRVKVVDMAKAILDRHSGELSWIPELNKMNTDLKYLFKLFGFTDMIQLSQGSGIARRESLVPKYELVSTHTARRTFINIMRKMKVDDTTIGNITGQSLAVLRGYYQPSDADVNEAMETLNSVL